MCTFCVLDVWFMNASQWILCQLGWHYKVLNTTKCVTACNRHLLRLPFDTVLNVVHRIYVWLLFVTEVLCDMSKCFSFCCKFPLKKKYENLTTILLLTTQHRKIVRQRNILELRTKCYEWWRHRLSLLFSTLSLSLKRLWIPTNVSKNAEKKSSKKRVS